MFFNLESGLFLHFIEFLSIILAAANVLHLKFLHLRYIICCKSFYEATLLSYSLTFYLYFLWTGS